MKKKIPICPTCGEILEENDNEGNFEHVVVCSLSDDEKTDLNEKSAISLNL